MNLVKRHNSPIDFLISSTFSYMKFLAAMRILGVIGCQSLLNAYHFKGFSFVYCM